MKILIDTKNKVIKLEDPTNLGEFFDFLEEVFPNVAERRSYTLSITNLVTEYIPQPTLPYPNPYDPYSPPWIVTFGTSVDEAYEK